ncbi:methyltransferase family protein [Raineyella fluvialis]|uniref:Isoprenylcysteine carboxyl methyltransferase n=1 Tax=Raineyella fluvialis TaxID=2662261 RepID=A0A5Q2F9I4_9ACTN|nr:isoprenylcysteine carboxylmethyltransferase family protein [Raineyella fluvialis]QGF23469.1 isoprenylcysteine carboxyl methyltransferase [Raineyella fluvialis]
MRKSVAILVALGWGGGLGAIVCAMLPYVLGYWRFQRPLPGWFIAQALGVVLIVLGLGLIALSFVEFIRAGGTPMPTAAPPRLVVAGVYRYVRNPIYLGLVVVLLGQALLFGQQGLLGYTAVAWVISAAAVRFYEQPRLRRKFGPAYEAYVHSVRAWIPRLHPWTLEDPAR